MESMPRRSDKMPSCASESRSSMIEIAVNGELRRFDVGTTIAALLDAMLLTGKRIAVERNGEIVPKSLHSVTPLAAGDQLEIVAAVGGG